MAAWSLKNLGVGREQRPKNGKIAQSLIKNVSNERPFQKN